jgi:O-antigen ligase
MINSILAGIVIASTLLFGSVEVWSSSAVLALVYAAGLFWVIRGEYHGAQMPKNIRPLFLVAVTFCAYIILQVVPLPSTVIGLISPETARTREFYSITPLHFMTLSFDPYKTINEILRIAAFFIVFFISSVAFTDRDKLFGMLVVLMLFGFCLAVFAIVQKATWNEKIYWFRELTAGGSPFGPFVNRNHFAGFIGMLIPLGLGYTLTREKREKKILFGFLTVVTAVSLFFSLSRGGIISFFAGIALFSLLILLTKIQQKKIWSIIFFLIALTAYLLYLGMDPVIERFYKTDISKEQRIIVWATTLGACKDFWLTGTGLGTYIDIFPLYSPSDVQSIFDHAHNDYLEFMLETGAVGTALLLSFVAILAYSSVKDNFQGTRGMMKISLISSVFTMLVHSVFDFNLHILSNMLLFAIVLGMLSALSSPAEGKYPRRYARTSKEHPERETLPGPDNGRETEDWEKEQKK